MPSSRRSEHCTDERSELLPRRNPNSGSLEDGRRRELGVAPLAAFALALVVGAATGMMLPLITPALTAPLGQDPLPPEQGNIFETYHEQCPTEDILYDGPAPPCDNLRPVSAFPEMDIASEAGNALRDVLASTSVFLVGDSTTKLVALESCAALLPDGAGCFSELVNPTMYQVPRNFRPLVPARSAWVGWCKLNLVDPCGLKGDWLIQKVKRVI